MIALPPLDDLVATYSVAVENTQEQFTKRFHGLIGQTQKFQAQWETETPVGDDAIQIEAKAAENMARDLAYYRENARNVVDGLDGRFSMVEAIDRTNAILGDLTGLRKFFETLTESSLTHVEHARLDTRVEVLQEEIATKLIRGISRDFNTPVVFSADKGGLCFEWDK